MDYGLMDYGATDICVAEGRGYEIGYARALEDAWNKLDSLIRKGELPEHKHFERNGIVLAANAVMNMRHDQ